MRLSTVVILFAAIGCSSSGDSPPAADAAAADTATTTDVAAETGDSSCQASGEICDPANPTHVTPDHCCSGECVGPIGGTPRCN